MIFVFGITCIGLGMVFGFVAAVLAAGKGGK